jgi:glycosyltransferase involved in cell wall biosynthesis
MRITYLNPVGALGGAERSLLDMMASVRQARPSAKLSLILGTPGLLIEEAKRIGVRVIHLPMPPELVALGDSRWRDDSNSHGWNTDQTRTGFFRVKSVFHLWPQFSPRAGLATWDYIRRLRSTVAALRPDVVHSNGIKFHLLARLVARRSWPVVWHIRDFLSLRPLVGRLLRWSATFSRSADSSFRARLLQRSRDDASASPPSLAGIAISQAVEQDLHSVLGPLPVEMIYNAVDTQVFSPGSGDGAILDRLSGLTPTEPGTLRIGLVATFARWKGQELFLQAGAQFLRTNGDSVAAHHSPLTTRHSPARVRFYIIGGPIYSTRGSQYSEAELRKKASELGLADHFGLIGFQQNPANIYRALDVVVHASTQPEPFGRTIVEAMACGKPVIVSEAGGARELFTPNHDAVGFPPGNITALARRIKELVDVPFFRCHLADNARRTAVARFDRAHIGPQILAAYRRFLRPAA